MNVWKRNSNFQPFPSKRLMLKFHRKRKNQDPWIDLYDLKDLRNPNPEWVSIDPFENFPKNTRTLVKNKSNLRAGMEVVESRKGIDER